MLEDRLRSPPVWSSRKWDVSRSAIQHHGIYRFFPGKMPLPRLMYWPAAGWIEVEFRSPSCLPAQIRSCSTSSLVVPSGSRPFILSTRWLNGPTPHVPPNRRSQTRSSHRAWFPRQQQASSTYPTRDRFVRDEEQDSLLNLQTHGLDANDKTIVRSLALHIPRSQTYEGALRCLLSRAPLQP
jgi:hypothetical protein